MDFGAGRPVAAPEQLDRVHRVKSPERIQGETWKGPISHPLARVGQPQSLLELARKLR